MKQDEEPTTELVHGEAFALLPWYTNESLPGAEAEQVRAHVAGCAACRQELAALDGLKSALIASDETLPAPPPEMLDRVLDRIEHYEADRVGPVRASSRLTGWRSRAAAFGFTWGQLALAGQVAALIVLVAALFFATRNARRFEDQVVAEKARADRSEQMLKESQQRYETLTGPGNKNGAADARLNVAFQERATEKEIRELLNSINATIVSGPSPQRIYVIAVPADRGKDRQQVADEALAKLRATAQVVWFAAKHPE